MTHESENAIISICIVFIILFFLAVGTHDCTFENTDIKIATILYEHKVPLEKLEANQGAFEDYIGLKKQYLLLHYKENAERAESRKVEK